MMGDTMSYYIKGSNYKSVMNGSMMQWQLYINNDNRLYNKMANSETLQWNDGAINKDEVLKSELNKGVTEILGYTCDELILTCKSGVQKYYFNSKLGVDPKLHDKHQFGNWYVYLTKSKSLPLKTIVESEHFTMVSTAVAVKEMKLKDVFFELPEMVDIMVSPN